MQDELAGRGWLLEERRFDRNITLFVYSPDGILNDYVPINEPWGQVTQTIAEAAADDAAVVICPEWTVESFNYYWRHYDNETATFGGKGLFSDNELVSPFLEPAASGRVANWRQMGEQRHPADLLDEHSELWIVGRGGSPSATCGLAVLQSALVGRGRLVEERLLGSNLTLLAYVPADQAS